MPVKKSTTNGNGNGNGNGKTATKTKPEAPETEGSLEERAAALCKQIRSAIYKQYKVALELREKRIQTRLFYACKEKLGLDISAQLQKANKKMDWQTWNNKICPSLLGKPEQLKHDPQVLALALAQMYDSLSLDPLKAVEDLIEFNQKSLEKRAQQKADVREKAELDDLDDLDDLDEEEDDDEEDDLDDDDDENDDDDEDDDELEDAE